MRTTEQIEDQAGDQRDATALEPPRGWWERLVEFPNRLMRGFERVLVFAFGSANDRYIKKMCQPQVDAINRLEDAYRDMSDAELSEQVAGFRERLRAGEAIDDLLIEALATCREVARRVLDVRYDDADLIGAVVLHHGVIAEMTDSGERMLIAVLPAFLSALEGKSTHIIAVKQDVVHRNMEWMAAFYGSLGVTFGVLQSDKGMNERRAAYDCDITFGTEGEYRSDHSKEKILGSIPSGCCAIIDEVDTILTEQPPGSSVTVAWQTFLQGYARISGISGAAMAKAGDFWKSYKLEVIVVGVAQDRSPPCVQHTVDATQLPSREETHVDGRVGEEEKKTTAVPAPVEYFLSSANLSRVTGKSFSTEHQPRFPDKCVYCGGPPEGFGEWEWNYSLDLGSHGVLEAAEAGAGGMGHSGRLGGLEVHCSPGTLGRTWFTTILFRVRVPYCAKHSSWKTPALQEDCLKVSVVPWGTGWRVGGLGFHGKLHQVAKHLDFRDPQAANRFVKAMFEFTNADYAAEFADLNRFRGHNT